MSVRSESLFARKNATARAYLGLYWALEPTDR